MGFAPSGFNFNNLANFGGKGKYSQPEFVWTQVVAPTALEFLSSNKLGTSYQNDLFVADFNKGRIYDFNLNSARTGLHLTGVLTDRKANTDSELQQVIFGEGFGGISDLKVGNGDGYLYVLSYGSGAIFKILPKSASATSSATITSGDKSSQTTSGNDTNQFASSNKERRAQMQLQKQQDITKRINKLKNQQQKEQEQQQKEQEQQQKEQEQQQKEEQQQPQQQQHKQTELTGSNQTSADNTFKDDANKQPP